MVSVEEFVESSIAHQLGDISACAFSHDADAFEAARRGCSGMTLAWDHAGDGPYPFNGYQGPREGKPRWAIRNPNHGNVWKTRGALEPVLRAGADFDFLVDMQDHRGRNIVTEDMRAPPVFAFNRPVARPWGRVLWPLPKYQDLDSPDFLGGLDPERVPWRDKQDRVAWRGGPGNRGRLGKTGGGGQIRLVELLRRYKAGTMGEEEALRVLRTMSRYAVLERFGDDPRFDVGFTNAHRFTIREEPFIDRLERPIIPREQFQTFKYILVLPGSDVGSSFYWTMNSGSLGLVMDCDFESFATAHFRPWEHYVPFGQSVEELEDVLEWCAAHQEECEAMTRRAAQVCRLLARSDLRDEISRGVIDRMRAALPAGERGWARPPE
ncbi:Glycosyl transferase family 90 [Salinihabitans flavidus]|uniref:Glycosyl transferase family 90 n=1 Tax=Salinihabitans flavidus TaxID=569882 RepID=A0A1H8LSS1_9RHOB|nr:glycosyl transferase family 90 [Salinihabitans flavidus]SEO08144.1 Glycosyl transferase family 90 [Salinihabitans flavidus]